MGFIRKNIKTFLFIWEALEMLFDVFLFAVGVIIGFEIKKWLVDNKPENIIRDIENDTDEKTERIRFEKDVKELRKIIGGNLK